MASFFHSTILNHDSLQSALSFQLASKLGNPIMPAMGLREIIEKAFSADPEILNAVACDICAVTERDPAVVYYSTPLLYLKGFHALLAQLLDDVEDLLDNQWRQAQGRLVQKQQPWLAHQRPPYGQHLLLAA